MARKAEQDVVRRTILKERDVPGGANIGLLSTVAHYALDGADWRVRVWRGHDANPDTAPACDLGVNEYEP